jgi:hypothetical protein
MKTYECHIHITVQYTKENPREKAIQQIYDSCIKAFNALGKLTLDGEPLPEFDFVLDFAFIEDYDALSDSADLRFNCEAECESGNHNDNQERINLALRNFVEEISALCTVINVSFVGNSVEEDTDNSSGFVLKFEYNADAKDKETTCNGCCCSSCGCNKTETTDNSDDDDDDDEDWDDDDDDDEDWDEDWDDDEEYDDDDEDIDWDDDDDDDDWEEDDDDEDWED